MPYDAFPDYRESVLIDNGDGYTKYATAEAADGLTFDIAEIPGGISAWKGMVIDWRIVAGATLGASLGFYLKMQDATASNHQTNHRIAGDTATPLVGISHLAIRQGNAQYLQIGYGAVQDDFIRARGRIMVWFDASGDWDYVYESLSIENGGTKTAGATQTGWGYQASPPGGVFTLVRHPNNPSLGAGSFMDVRVWK